MTEPSFVAPALREEAEEEFDRSLRPQSLADFVGPGARQGAARGRARRGAAPRRGARPRAARRPARARQDLARADRPRELDVGIRQVAGPALERKGDIAAILTALEPRDVLFVDEIHRLNRAVEEILYPALEDFRLDIIVGQGPAARTLTLDLPPFTLVGATTRTGLLTTPLRDRFGLTFRLDLYAPDELGVDRAPQRAHPRRRDRRRRGRRDRPPRRAARRGSRTASCAACATWPRCGTPGAITTAIAEEALELLEVDEAGLERFDRDLLRAVVEKFGGGPVGLSTLAVALGEESETIEDVYEPYLLQLGFLQRTPRGRIVTDLGRAHVGPVTRASRETSTLF